MPVGLVSGVIEAIMNGPEGGTPASFTIAGVDPLDPSKIYTNSLTGIGRETDAYDFSEKALQYWPETLTDSIETGWSFREIGGASHALAQWGSNNGRTITFDVELSRMMMPVRSRSRREQYYAYLVDPADNAPIDNRPFNVDIKAQIRYLRAFCYPTYGMVSDITVGYPPPVMILNVPNLGLNEAGGDAIFCVMTGCDVVYKLAFRDGTPRRATVSIVLRQIVQNSNGIMFRGFQDANARYKFSGDEGLDRNAGRKVGGLDPLKVK